MDTDPTTGYALIDCCAQYFNGALKFDYKWFLVREQLVIGTASWNTMRDTAWSLMANNFPSYDPNTFFKATVNGASEGCTYTPCQGIELGLNNCPP